MRPWEGKEHWKMLRNGEKEGVTTRKICFTDTLYYLAELFPSISVL